MTVSLAIRLTDTREREKGRAGRLAWPHLTKSHTFGWDGGSAWPFWCYLGRILWFGCKMSLTGSYVELLGPGCWFRRLWNFGGFSTTGGGALSASAGWRVGRSSSSIPTVHPHGVVCALLGGKAGEGPRSGPLLEGDLGLCLLLSLNR